MSPEDPTVLVGSIAIAAEDSRLTRLVMAIREANTRYNAAESDLTIARVELGKALLAIRGEYGYGKWEPFLASEGIASQRASEAIRAAEFVAAQIPDGVGDLVKPPSMSQLRPQRAPNTLPRAPKPSKAEEQPDPVPSLTVPGSSFQAFATGLPPATYYCDGYFGWGPHYQKPSVVPPGICSRQLHGAEVSPSHESTSSSITK